MNKEIVIITVSQIEIVVFESGKEPKSIKVHNHLIVNWKDINILLRDELTRLYNEGFSIQTSNVGAPLLNLVTYVLAK